MRALGYAGIASPSRLARNKSWNSKYSPSVLAKHSLFKCHAISLEHSSLRHEYIHLAWLGIRHLNRRWRRRYVALVGVVLAAMVLHNVVTFFSAKDSIHMPAIASRASMRLISTTPTTTAGTTIAIPVASAVYSSS